MRRINGIRRNPSGRWHAQPDGRAGRTAETRRVCRKRTAAETQNHSSGENPEKRTKTVQKPQADGNGRQV